MGSASELFPKGEALTRALKWLGEERLHRPDVPVAKLIDEASLKFDLTPMNQQFLLTEWAKSR